MTAQPTAPDPEYAALAAVAVDWMERVWRRRDLAAIGELHAPDFRDRSPAGRDPGLAAYAAGVAELFAAFPDFETTTEDLVVDTATATAAIRWTAAGTHRGVFPRRGPHGAPDHLPRHRDHPHRRRADHRALGRVGRS